MTLSNRQQEILKSAVLEYIQTAQPVSSQLLEERSSLAVSPATIRSELQMLVETGFLSQPHISSGRVPTDKGYRFFVDEIYESEELDLLSEIEDSFDFLQAMTRELAQASSHLVITHVPTRPFLFKEGWEGVLSEPEFQDKESLLNFTKFLRDVERRIDDLEVQGNIDIYIGDEYPYSKVGDFSILISKLPTREKGFLALIGPKRMPYKRNINLLQKMFS
ncbi:MAG TPA: hypothetical protein ENI13_00130 [candidate division CPR3 bacterium]|uniref:Heat-inducible transcription repressor HrcA C-terminal domain-containing protein n=1 Tax=candidate division CPR3 bacterium TaxID=2268181 RepID=A0A7C1NPD2_UNCC3|nr:hypothetical protein [Patescibacteria group bacterium]HEB13369.1 hypothetical protein [candidate division CPR3 bacterium]